MKRTIYEAEHEAFRETVREFIERECRPNHEKWEQQRLVDRSAYVAAGGEATEGTIAAAQYDPHSSNPVAAPLLEKAQADTGQADIPLNFAYAFDAVNMVATLIKEKNLAPDGTDIANARRQIQEGLNAMDRYVGMADVTTFAEDGTAERPQLRSVVQGGKFVIDKSAS